MIAQINQNQPLLITPPEEGALAAWNPIQETLMKLLGISYRVRDMSIAERVLTNGYTVDDAGTEILSDKSVTYVKGPGITPRDDQVISAVIALEKAGELIMKVGAYDGKRKEKLQEIQKRIDELRTEFKPHLGEENMIRFAHAVAGCEKEMVFRGVNLEPVKGAIDKIGSPNAKWRDKAAVTLYRGTSPEVAARSTNQPPSWNKDTPLHIEIIEPKDGVNRFMGEHTGTDKVFMKILGADGTEIRTIEMPTSEGSAVRMFVSREKEVESFVKTAMAKFQNNVDGLLESRVSKFVDEVFSKLVGDEQKQAVCDAINNVLGNNLEPKLTLEGIGSNVSLSKGLLDAIDKKYEGVQDKLDAFLNDVQTANDKLPNDHPLKAYKSTIGVIHGAKATVLKTFDSLGNTWMSTALSAIGLSDKIMPAARKKDDAGYEVLVGGKPVLGDEFLIDNVHAILSTWGIKDPTAFLIANPSFSQYVRDFWEEIKQVGEFKAPKNSEIIRASATMDHYKAAEFANTNGKGKRVVITDATGKELTSAEIGQGDVIMATTLNKVRVREMVEQVMENALNSKSTTVLFGFGDQQNDKYYGLAHEVLSDVLRNSGDKYDGITVEVLTAAKATAKYFTGGLENAKLVLPNVHGDFATDIELAGKGTSYSTGFVGDETRRLVVELGTGGTAPDQIGMWKQRGFLGFNPMSFIEGLSYALGGAAKIADKQDAQFDNRVLEDTSRAVEQGLFAAIDKGYMVPIMKRSNMTKKDGSPLDGEIIVGTHTFVQAVLVETLTLLKDKHPAATAESIDLAQQDLARMTHVDKTIMSIVTGDKSLAASWFDANAIYNNSRVAAGKIDPFNQDFDLKLPISNDNYKNINPENLLELQCARAALMGAIAEDKNVASNKYRLTQAYKDIGLEDAVNLAREDIKVAEVAAKTSNQR